MYSIKVDPVTIPEICKVSLGRHSITMITALLMKILSVALLIILGSQVTVAQSDCDCSKTLEQLVFKVEHEYPGFGAYTKDSLAYLSFKKQRMDLSRSTNESNCFDILNGYTKYFKRSHLSIVQQKINSEDFGTKAVDTINIDRENFQNHVKHTTDVFEGIWTSGSYKVGVVKKDQDYVAFIISAQNKSWKEKEIKFKFDKDGSAIYFMGDHSQVSDTCRLIKNSILYFCKNKITLTKTFPQPPLSGNDLTDEINELQGFSLKPLSSQTLLLRIPSFGYENRERIEDLIKAKKPMLDSYENLIIDVRGNSGGTDYSFRPILPYLYTNPVRHLSGDYLVTFTLIKSLTDWVNDPANTKESDLENVKQDIKRMEGNIGKFIPYNTGERFGYIKQDSVLLFPKNVVILADGESGSSTENFIMNAKQSKKVKILGTPTYGCIDYLSVIEFELNCDKYILYMPTVRLERAEGFPIDNIGIQPDIYMDKFVKDWILYAKDYLENKMSACITKPTLKEEVLTLKKEWGFKFPLPSKNDTINLLFIEMEKSYFTFESKNMDSVASKILSIDSTFYMALSFQAFKKWPFDLEKLRKAKKYSLNDTSIQRLIFGGDYSYWIEHDTVGALKQYTEVYNRYPDSKIAAWLAGMASLWSKDYSRALFYYNRSLEIDPTFYHAYYDIGDTYKESNQYEKSIENFKIFLTHYPSKYRIHTVIGDLYLALKDPVNAKKHYLIADSLKNVYSGTN